MRVECQARGIGVLGFFASMLIVFFSFQPSISAQTDDDSATKTPGPWKRWTQYMDPTLQRVIELDLWGISTPQLPKGIWKVKYSYDHQKAKKKFDDSGKKVPIAPTLAFPWINEGETIFTMDLQGQTGGGEGVGHTIQMSYGMTDRLNWYIEFPFQDAEVQFDTTYAPGNPTLEGRDAWPIINSIMFGKFNVDPSSKLYNPLYPLIKDLDLRREGDFWKWIELMGRPKLKTHYKSDSWDLGDIHFGLSWNYFKGKNFAAATTGRLYVPTGYQPDANNNIELFTGAGFPSGTRTFGLSTTQGVDFRLPDPLKWVVFNAECTYEYRFKTRRHSPTFPQRTQYYQDFLFPILSELEPEIAAVFPDLSHMGDYYYITYGNSFDGEVGVTLNPLQILPIGIKYAAGWSQKPKIKSQSKDFADYVEGVEIVGEQVKHVLAVGTGISLIPFYIPLNIIFEYRFPLAGKGAFVVDEEYKITTELFLIF
jgi:hypothetical protein